MEHSRTSASMGRNLPARLSAKYRESFAFLTVSGRLPVILTQVIDTVYQYRIKASEQHGQAGADDCKAIAGKLSALKNHMQTDKPLMQIADDRPDVSQWNQYLDEETQRVDGIPPSWFKSAWLYVECYMYRVINEVIAQSQCLNDFDPFSAQKQAALFTSQDAMLILATHLDKVTTDGNASFDKFAEFVQISLWGNRCDLSISAGGENSQTVSPLSQLVILQPKILASDLNSLWQILGNAIASCQTTSGKQVRLDVVLDNAGFELFTDLVLMDYLLQVKLVNVVHVHMKAMPWFVSDVVRQDFEWTLQTLCENENQVISSLARRFQERVSEGTCILHEHRFWTTFHEFSSMPKAAPDLYQELGHADLVIFKGDLNYRKLVSDRSWPHTTTFEEALCGFHPAPLCTLRTLKCDVVVGLREGVAEATEAKAKKWMVTGEYAVIQYCGRVVKSA